MLRHGVTPSHVALSQEEEVYGQELRDASDAVDGISIHFVHPVRAVRDKRSSVMVLVKKT